MKRFAAPLLLGLLAGCTWVTPSPEAMNADIQVLDKAGAARCQQLGANEITVNDKLGTLKRMPEDVEHDLRTMAINQAATVGADAVAPLTDLNGGTQTWALLRCNGAAPAPAANAQTAAPAATSGIKTVPYTPPR